MIQALLHYDLVIRIRLNNEVHDIDLFGINDGSTPLNFAGNTTFVEPNPERRSRVSSLWFSAAEVYRVALMSCAEIPANGAQ